MIKEGSKVKILEVSAEDAFYADRRNLVGMKGIIMGVINWDDSWTAGDIRFQEGRGKFSGKTLGFHRLKLQEV